MKNGSELVVLAEEIHESILKKVESNSSLIYILNSKRFEICSEIIPESLEEFDGVYRISDGINYIHIVLTEVEHIEKEEDIDSTYYELHYNNGDTLNLIMCKGW